MSDAVEPQVEPREAGAARRPQAPAGLLVLLGVSIAVYLKVVGLGAIPAWDDLRFVLERPELKDWWGAPWRDRLLTPEIGYPIAVPTAIHAALHAWFGAGFVPAAHVANLLVHLLNVVLVFALVRQHARKTVVASVVTSLWALHPLLVESVAWLTNLKTLTLAACTFGALLAWGRFLRSRSRPALAAYVGLSLLALGCRPEGAVIPLLAGLWALAAAGRPDPRTALLPAIQALLYLPFVAYATSSHASHVASHVEGHQIDVDLLLQLKSIAAALALQLQHALVPLGLHPLYYPFDHLSAGQVVLGAVIFVSLAGATLYAGLRRHPAFAGLALWWVAYLPASGIFFLPRFTADTYMYIPLLGLIYAATMALAGGGDAFSSRRSLLMPLLLSIVFGALSFVQLDRWQDEQSLFVPVLVASPDAPLPYIIVARGLLERGQRGEALAVFSEAEEVLIEHDLVPIDMLGLYEHSGRPEQAVLVAIETLRRYPGNLGLQGSLAWILLRNRLSIPDDPQSRQIVETAVREAVSRFGGAWGSEQIMAGAHHMRSEGLEESAHALAAEALRLAAGPCETWRREQGLMRALEISMPPGCSVGGQR